MLVSYRPAPPLASHVEMLWHYDGQPTASHRETVLPNGKFQITINLASGHGTVCGIRSQHSVIETAAIPAIIGIVLRPGGARAFFGAPANDFLNKTLPLESVWGWRAAQLRNQLLEAGTVGSQFRVLENGL